MKAILIEDDSAVRDAIVRMLAKRQLDLTPITDTRSAPDVAARLEPDIILLAAAELYDRRGRYLPELLKAKCPYSCLVVLGGPEPAPTCNLWKDVDTFLSYPVDAARLEAAIDRCRTETANESTASEVRA
jgi:DNA-binding response OmpR family regulator